MPRVHPERYQLLGEIARGGMGVVLKGRDPDLGRDMAVKVLRADLAGRPAAVQRFVEEAQVGGQLQHPGVVPVYDLGRFADGRPYFAMKLVKGRTLADHLADRPDPAADRVKFLQVFLQVCQTVGFAHSRGVIHRDLKPSNVMVGSFGEVLVMDWGLAKVLPRGGLADEDRASQASRRVHPGGPPEEPTEIRTVRAGSGSDTAAGSVLGTPAFMPPEQAGGEIDKLDERSDVFGLGAMLCAILTGRPPYLADTPEEVRLMAIRGKVADAFGRLDNCGADAELIALCKRCLAAERDDRPRHAGEVTAAVESHLSGVEARARQAELDRAAAEVRACEGRKRRRVQLALAAAVGLLLLGGGAFGWWQDRQAAERKREQIEFAAEHARVEAERAADERARRERNAEAVGGLIGQCEDALRADDAEKAGLALEAAQRRAAEGGADGLRDRLDRCRGDLDMLRALDRIDELRWTMKEGQYSDSRKVAEEWSTAFARYGIVPSSTPPDAARRIAGSLLRDRLLQALDEWHFRFPSERLSAIIRAADPDPFRDAVRAACAARNRSQVRALGDRPEALDQPGRFAAAMGDIDFLPTQRRKQLLVAALGRRPGDLGLLMALGYLYPPNSRETAVEREKWCRAAVAVRPGCVAAHNNLGNALRDQGDLDGALAEFREAIRLDPKPALPHLNLGCALADRGDWDGALAELREAARLEPKSTLPHLNLGIALRKMGDLDGAVIELREAVRLDPKHALSHNNLGVALERTGDLAGAVAAYREAVRLDPKCAYAHNNLGAALAGRGDQDGAVAAYREAARLDPQYAHPHYNLGLVLVARGDHDGAVAEYREAIRLDPRHARAHYGLGNALQARRDLRGAEAAFREAIRIDPSFPEAYCNLGLLLLDRQGRPAEALPLLRRGHELGSRRPGWKYPSQQWVADCERALAAQGARTAPPPREVKR
jgi:Flp pilus assembly protein TadD